MGSVTVTAVRQTISRAKRKGRNGRTRRLLRRAWRRRRMARLYRLERLPQSARVLESPDVTVSTFRSLGGTKALSATTEATFREGVKELAESRNDFTMPADGWPWLWPSSALTDYTYAFDAGSVYASHRGSQWFLVNLTRADGGEPKRRDMEDHLRPDFPRMVDSLESATVRRA